MNSTLNRESAKVYQFPRGGRSAPDGRRTDETKSADHQGSLRVNEAPCSGNWYHEAAIQESNPAWKR